MRRFDLLIEYSTVISPALAPRSRPCAGSGKRGRRFALPAAASLLVCIAAVAVL